MSTNQYPFADNTVQGALAVDVAFGNRTPTVGGWLVVATLDDIAGRTERIASRIASELYSTDLGDTLSR